MKKNPGYSEYEGKMQKGRILLTLDLNSKEGIKTNHATRRAINGRQRNHFLNNEVLVTHKEIHKKHLKSGNKKILK